MDLAIMKIYTMGFNTDGYLFLWAFVLTSVCLWAFVHGLLSAGLLFNGLVSGYDLYLKKYKRMKYESRNKNQ